MRHQDFTHCSGRAHPSLCLQKDMKKALSIVLTVQASAFAATEALARAMPAGGEATCSSHPILGAAGHVLWALFLVGVGVLIAAAVSRPPLGR